MSKLILDKFFCMKEQLKDVIAKFKTIEKQKLCEGNDSDRMYYKGQKEAFEGSLILLLDLETEVLTHFNQEEKKIISTINTDYIFIVKKQEDIIGTCSILCDNFKEAFQHRNKLLFYVYEEATDVEVFRYENGSLVRVNTDN
ncbi:hypothetical protein [Bacillus thuringiensis]|uniref:Uncharacterized protein n=1 Tax=Bacillus thuringiensis TaxID=1428 RepID=A0A9X7GFX2_BACTU|nr:hypothetical protein [Bacillus thuringiensis]PFV35777.1 hypothetical protein COK99_01775 [Bacillus thuringiensis]